MDGIYECELSGYDEYGSGVDSIIDKQADEHTAEKARSSQLNVMRKLLKRINLVRSRNTAGRDFAEFRSIPVGRGAYFQVRKLAGGTTAAKYPVIHNKDGGGIEIHPKNYIAAAQELLVLRHGPLRSHRNIVNIVGICWTRVLPSFMPITLVEYAPHGTLANYLGVNPYIDSGLGNSLMQDIARGLQALHACGITHGDLKMDNILIFDVLEGQTPPLFPVEAKLSDFGSSVLVSDGETRLTGHLPRWSAPESKQNILPHNLHLCDIYAFGLVCWCLALNGKEPFEGMDDDAIESHKLSDLVISCSIQSIEEEYDTKMLLRGDFDDRTRFFVYRNTVSMPRRVFEQTLTLEPTKRSLQKAQEILSNESFYG